MESLFANRLLWLLEEHSSISPWQAGFRKGRSTTDRCIWLSQFISDGFQSIQSRRTARVRVNGSIGPSRTYKESLLQGFVLYPLIFTIYIDDLLAEFEKDASVSAYAGDLLVVRSARNKDIIVASLQPEVDKVVAWSHKATLTHIISKCVTSLFSLDCAETPGNHCVTTDGKRMFSNPLPIFLLVKYNRQPNFGKHVQRLCQSMCGRINLLRALWGMTWKWQASSVIRYTSRWCVACLNMQLLPGFL